MTRQTVLGANGTIGCVLATELRKYTDQVRLVSRNPRKSHESDELFPLDLSLPGQVEKAVEGSSVVYLVVGFEYKLRVWQDVWPRLMRETLDACAKHDAKLVFFDNVYMYGRSSLSRMTEDSPLDPPSRKGAVRLRIARMLLDDCRSGKVQGLIARSADFYGPGNERSFLTELVYKNLRKGSKARWLADADKLHSFTYTPDAARATALLGNAEDAYGQVWHLPTDPHSLTGRQLAALFASEMGAQDRLSILPTWLIRGLGVFMPFMRELSEMMYQYDRDYVFDSTKFDQRYPFQKTTYAQGVKATVASR
jgi:nucleoside-diphosphate-sugar epimerase